MCEERTAPPAGVHLDYEELLSIGTHGPIDSAAALGILLTEVGDANTRGHECLEKSREHLSHHEEFAGFALATAALREVTRVYPIHRSNRHNGERIPLGHAWEVAWESALLSYRGHYKAAYQRLREVLEMVVLQLFFYISQDESLVRSWGRAEMRTPSFRKMLHACANDSRCSSVATAFHLEESIGALYDQFGAYVHGRGLSFIFES